MVKNVAKTKNTPLGKGKLKKPLEKGKAMANQKASPLEKGDLNKKPLAKGKAKALAKGKASPLGKGKGVKKDKNELNKDIRL